LSNLHKIGKYGKEIRGKSEKNLIKIGENRDFHIFSIDTAPPLKISQETFFFFYSILPLEKVARKS